MSKRQRGSDEAAVRKAIELICQRPAKPEELQSAALTPLEKQVVQLKESVPEDALLLVACGYRVKFYGRDSRVASRRLGIMCIRTTPFEYSSIPYVRVNLYIHRLVAMGYRVAFADQENASIRASNGNAKGIFTREISRVYSRGTLLPSEVIGDSNATAIASSAAVDTSEQTDVVEEEEEDIHTSDVLCTSLKEASSELYMCFLKVPSLLLSSSSLSLSSSQTPVAMEVKLVSFVTYSVSCHHVTTETELLDVLQRHDIVEVIIFSENSIEKKSQDRNTSPLQCLPEGYASALNTILPLHFGPTCNGEEDGRSVTVCVEKGAGTMDELIAKYLVPYKLDKVYEKMCASCGELLSSSSLSLSLLHDNKEGIHNSNEKMELPGSTLSALDVFYSSIGTKGSLLALLDHNLTVPGVRRLRMWVAAPPCDLCTIFSRRDAVSFLLQGKDGNTITHLLRECAKFGDIEATLGKLQSKRCTIAEYLHLLRAVATTSQLASDILSESTEEINKLIQELLLSITSVDITSFLQSCQSEVESQATTPLDYFTKSNVSLPTTMEIHVKARDNALRCLDEELEKIRLTLNMPTLEYRTIAGTSFIIDVPQAKCDRAPKEWLVLTRTKSHVRFHTPNIINFNIELSSAKERLLIAANEAWQEKQEQIANSREILNIFQNVINVVATLDALRSLSVTSSAPGYVAPEISEDTPYLSIINGRHPVLDKIMRGGYVGCSVRLSRGGAWILTGPNMGGKSALMRMVGVFVVMAQLGCYVPATAAQLPLFKAIYCRMGASDSLLEGASTFLKEMEETSRILRSPFVSSSLVLLDEVGRGTSSFDGIAVAAATLEYLLQRKATTLFVTHYSHLCEPYVNGASGEHVDCYYMGFREEKNTNTNNNNNNNNNNNDDDNKIDKVKEENGTNNNTNSHSDNNNNNTVEASNLVFTYQPTRGITPSSFGVRVAQMAGLPSAVVAEAQRLSALEEKEQTARVALMQLRRFVTASSF
ncbi:mismatch repair protein MSH3 [Trypanosoma theileri]|uniref:Mismatch repair protein MSH3 n=1 Tax=Trypanosoma theileri TaxID=67003 RepID=A0A1X0NU18_9TRYP|nr:mismatch repair protein MSH3 [Trypanosoma theileri]ORC88206.1 mismatch repair protein MSH3 [Trypanosoma theileri]